MRIQTYFDTESLVQASTFLSLLDESLPKLYHQIEDSTMNFTLGIYGIPWIITNSGICENVYNISVTKTLFSQTP